MNACCFSSISSVLYSQRIEQNCSACISAFNDLAFKVHTVACTVIYKGIATIENICKKLYAFVANNLQMTQLFQEQLQTRIENKQKILTQLSLGEILLSSLEETWKKDRDVVKKAIERNPLALFDADPLLQKDDDLLLNALQHQDANDELTERLLEINGLLIQHAHSHIKENKKLALKAINQNPKAFEHIAKKLMQDHDFLCEGMKENPKDLDFQEYCLSIFPDLFKVACPVIQSDEKIALDVIKRNHKQLIYVDRSLRKNANFLVQAFEKSPQTIFLFTEDEKNLDAIGSIVAKRFPAYFHHLSERLKDKKEIVLEAVKIDGSVIKFAGETCKNDVEIAIAAVESDAEAYSELPEELQYNIAIIKEAVYLDQTIYDQLPEELKANKELAIQLVQKDPSLIEILPQALQEDIDVISAASID